MERLAHHRRPSLSPLWDTTAAVKCTLLHSAHYTMQCNYALRGSWVLWQSLLPGDLTGDQLTGPQLLHWSKVAQPIDGAAEKEGLHVLFPIF